MFEVSDRNGSVIALIGDRESPSGRKVSILNKSGYTVKEIAHLFSVREERINQIISTLNLSKNA